MSRMKTRQPTRYLVSALLPCAAGWAAGCGAGAGGSGGWAADCTVGGGAEGWARRAPHLSQKLPAPTSDPHCPQNGIFKDATAPGGCSQPTSGAKARLGLRLCGTTEVVPFPVVPFPVVPFPSDVVPFPFAQRAPFHAIATTRGRRSCWPSFWLRRRSHQIRAGRCLPSRRPCAS